MDFLFGAVASAADPGDYSSFVRLNSSSAGRHDPSCKSGGLAETSGGVFFGGNPFSRVLPLLMIQYVLFFLISRSISFLLRPIHQPRFVCDTLAGIIIGPTVLGRIPMISAAFYSARQLVMVDTLATLGISLYIFIIAVKSDTSVIMKTDKRTWLVALSGLLTPMSLIVFLIKFLHHRFPDLPDMSALVVIGINVSCTAFINVVPILDKLYLSTTPVGQLAMSSAIINDFFLWIFWLMVLFVRGGLGSTFTMIPAVAGFVLVVFFVFRPAMRMIVKETPEGQPVKEFFITSILLTVLIMGQISGLFSGSCFFGSLLVGLVVPSGPPLGSALVDRSQTFITSCIMPFFYLAVGAHVDIGRVQKWKVLIVCQCVLMSGAIAKLLGTMLPSLFCKLSIRHAFIAGLVMNIRGVLETALYRNMLLHKHLETAFYDELVLSSVAVTALLTPLVKVLYELSSSSEEGPREFYGMSVDISNKLGSDMRTVICIRTEDDVPGILRLLEASTSSITGTSHMRVHAVHLNELTGRVASLFARHEKHSRMCKHNGCITISNALEKYSRNSHGKATLDLFTMIAPCKAMHEGVCSMARDIRACLIIVPYSFRGYSFSSQGIESFSRFESNIEAHAPCTVGLLVERSNFCKPTYQKDQDYFSYRVIVIFIGGEDDREALAYAYRMSDNPLLDIVILRISMKDDEVHLSKEEKVLDELLIKDFQSKNMNNPRALYKEVVVDGWEGAIGAVRSFDFNGFDLAMVGRQQDECSLLCDKMTSMTDRPELGLLGDMLASPDFLVQSFSVLVMQHFKPGDDNSFVRVIY